MIPLSEFNGRQEIGRFCRTVIGIGLITRDELQEAHRLNIDPEKSVTRVEDMGQEMYAFI